MKNKLITLTTLTLFMFASLTNIFSQNKSSKIQEVTFIVSMDCMHCVKKLEAKLPFVKGVKDIKVTLDTKTVWFQYDTTKTNKKNLVKAINDLGYTADEKKL